MTDALAHHASVAAEHAEVEAANLRVELRKAHDTIIRCKSVAWRQALASLLFYGHELHKRDGMTDAELVEDVAKIGGIGMAITGECIRYRRRWGAACQEEASGQIREAKALLWRLVKQTRPMHRRAKAAGPQEPTSLAAALLAEMKRRNRAKRSTRPEFEP